MSVSSPIPPWRSLPAKQLHIPSRPSLAVEHAHLWLQLFARFPPVHVWIPGLKLEVVLSGFLVGYLVFPRRERAKGIN